MQDLRLQFQAEQLTVLEPLGLAQLGNPSLRSFKGLHPPQLPAKNNKLITFKSRFREGLRPLAFSKKSKTIITSLVPIHSPLPYRLPSQFLVPTTVLSCSCHLRSVGEQYFGSRSLMPSSLCPSGSSLTAFFCIPHSIDFPFYTQVRGRAVLRQEV